MSTAALRFRAHSAPMAWSFPRAPISRQSEGKSSTLTRSIVLRWNACFDHHVAGSERLVLDEHLQQSERLIRCRVDHENSLRIPPPAVEPRALSREGGPCERSASERPTLSMAPR